MNLLAISTDQGITWGDLLIILGVVALFLFCFAYFPRRRP
jgi:hypothetical protein